jgi:putative transposase
MGSSTFYQWSDQYAGIEASGSKRLQQMKVENRKLKLIFVEPSLKSQL